MSNELKQNDESHSILDYPKGIIKFTIKTIIVAIASIFTIASVIPEIPKIPETERNKLVILSFVQNPYVLWRLSEIEEEKGNVKNATTYIEAAIGLMEMNGASDKSLSKYQERLEKINPK